MNATDEPRRLLDERGVEWKEHRHTLAGSMAIQRETLWGQPIDNTSGKPIPHIYHCRATEMGDGRLFLEAQLVTPAQAVEATLGLGTCSLVREYFGQSGNWYRLVCSECHHIIYDGWQEKPRYCPFCGRKVVDA